MKKLLIGVLIASIGTISVLDARVYKGQREYIKKCRECHGDGQKMLVEREIMEWEEMMESKGRNLAQLHLDDEAAKASWKYFESDRYKDKTKDLLDFMKEYASDSGNVPACN